MYEHYDFKQVGKRVVQVTEFNTRMIWLKEDNRIAVAATIKARAKYWAYRKSAPVRHYVKLMHLIGYRTLWG